MSDRKEKTPPKRRPRLVPRGREFGVIRTGHRRAWFGDLYVHFLSMPWLTLFLASSLIYVGSNFAFAGFYYFNRDGILNAHTFTDMFFFSVQTMATIGYGRMAPISYAVNVAVAFEALWGFTFFAFVTGLVFAKFSRPTARVLFSDVAAISDYEGTPHLKIRLANERANRIVDARISLVLLRDGMTKEGFRMRRFYDLRLVRNTVPLLQLTWTLLHPIDKDSPLYGATTESLRNMEDEIIVSLTGHDETLSQIIYARHSYVADEIICDAFFEDVLTRHDDGRVEVNYKLFHSTRPATEREKAQHT